MVKIDLITGFLGAGKTTFIKKYAKYLIDKGENICILENDYGAVNVDMMLLSDLCSEKCELEMVSGGCDIDCHRRRFKTKLISMGMCGYDRVIVEPSGIYEVDEFFDALHEEPLDRWYEIGNVITIVEGIEIDEKINNISVDVEEAIDSIKSSTEAKYLMASQCSCAGAIVISKLDDNEKDESITTVNNTLSYINHCMEEFNCKRRYSLSDTDNFVVYKDWECLDDKDFDKLLKCGYKMYSVNKFFLEDNDSYETCYFMNCNYSCDEIKEIVDALFDDKECGEVIRVKGFLRIDDNQWYEINATRNECDIKIAKNGQAVIIVIGEEMKREIISKYFSNCE